MAIMEISVIPLGTKSPSVSKYVAIALKELKKQRKVKYSLTAMGTIVEGDLDILLEVAKKMHRSVLKKEIKRVVTTIKIDERVDKRMASKGKINSVKKKI